MGFEIDIPTDFTDETDIEVLVHDSTATDILTRDLNLADWKVATNTGRMLVGAATNDDDEESTTNKEYTVILMNKSDVEGKRSVIYGGAAFLMASSTIFATAMLAL
jgi:hypothetical protein